MIFLKAAFLIMRVKLHHARVHLMPWRRPWWLRRRKNLTPDERFLRRYRVLGTGGAVMIAAVPFFAIIALSVKSAWLFIIYQADALFLWIMGYCCAISWLKMRRRKKTLDRKVARLMADFDKRGRRALRRWS